MSFANASRFIKLFFLAITVFFTIDMFWLGLVAQGFYLEELGFLMAENLNWTAAIIFYLLFNAGLVLFVILPAIAKKSWTHALHLGALFGLVTYATYDLTNLATIKDWPLLVTFVDLVWGTFLAASVSTVTFLISSKIKL